MAAEGAVPALVRTFLERVLPPEGALPSRVRLGQTGQMWLRPGGRALPFTAVEELAVGEVAFSWRARLRLLPLVPLGVVDRFSDGEGSLEARVFGLLPVMRQAGPEVSEGEASRYLAELGWVPHAMRGNRRLEWRELGERAVEVGTTVGPTWVSVRLDFDDAGDIVGARCDERPRVEAKRIARRPWVGSFGHYAVLGGIRLPTRAEVRWELPSGAFTYWRGTITSVGRD